MPIAATGTADALFDDLAALVAEVARRGWVGAAASATSFITAG